MSDYKYENTRMELLKYDVINLLSRCKANFKVIQQINNSTITNNYDFAQWVQVIYGGRSPYADEFQAVVEEIATLPPILACLVYKSIMDDVIATEKSEVYNMAEFKWEKEE